MKNKPPLLHGYNVPTSQECTRELKKIRLLKKLARVLTFKADIYGPNGRIYGFEHKFKVKDGKLFHGDKELDPSTLYDGHGRLITEDSNF